MKHLYALLLIGLSAIAPALAAPVALPDTMVGQARVVRLLADDMCTRLTAENEKHPLGDLSPEEAKSLLTQTMLSSISAHADDLQPLLSKSSSRRNKEIGEDIGKQAMMLLMRQCPQSQPLIMRLGLAEANIPTAANAEEKALLDEVAQDICTRLDKAMAANPNAKDSVSERQRLFQESMQGALLAHLEGISKVYGLDKLKDRSLMAGFGQKVAAQMGSICPNYVLQLGLDAQAGKGKSK